MSKQSRIKTRDTVLVDDLYMSPVDERQLRFRRRICRGLFLLFAVVVLWLWLRFTADRPVTYSDVGDHFKYGSIGAEPGGSLFASEGGVAPPYWILTALPKICPDMLPGGYAEVGLLSEEGMDRPIGVSRRYRLGTDLAGFNCAVCHTGTYRESEGSERHVVLGMPANQLRFQELTRFLVECPLSEEFTSDNVLAKIDEVGGDLGWLDRFIYRHLLIPRVREQTLRLGKRVEILLGDEVTAWGAGRIDTFNPYKAIQFGWKLADLPAGELTSAADYPSLWNQEPREGMELHWDGNNDSVDERNLSAAVGAGVTPRTVDHAGVARVAEWAWTLPPPPWPWPGEVDGELAGRGEALYAEHCLACHAGAGFRDGDREGAAKVGTVQPLEAIGTDPHRWASYTAELVEMQKTLFAGSEYAFTHFHKTSGYANAPLDGIWARAPYLHNGAVPTLRDLLEPPEARPSSFYRGYDVYDRERVGFVSTVASEDGTEYFFFDTALPGNSNAGHLYGTDLQSEDKDTIVEYMKTF